MVRCIHSPFTDIYFHLAAEEYLLKQGADDVFMLWQDTPSVVMGKHQSCTVGSEPGMGGRATDCILPVGFRVGELYIMIWVMSI